MKITNSLEWQTVRSELNHSIQSLPYDPQLRLMLKNIDTMVVELSKSEVDARRTKVNYYTQEKLSKVNESIVTLDKLIVLGALLS
jgi:hypothetical protein